MACRCGIKTDLHNSHWDPDALYQHADGQVMCGAALSQTDGINPKSWSKLVCEADPWRESIEEASPQGTLPGFD